MLLAFTGIVLVITNGNFSHLRASSSFIGDLLLLAATICWVIYTYFANIMISVYGWSALRVTALSSSLGTLSIIFITIAATLLGYASYPNFQAMAASKFDIFILVITTLVIISWNAGIKALGTINGVLFVNLVPVISYIIGLLQGHHVSYIEVLGMAVTLIALIMNNLYMRQNQADI